jgi:hypothetical protein
MNSTPESGRYEGYHAEAVISAKYLTYTADIVHFEQTGVDPQGSTAPLLQEAIAFIVEAPPE